jgi:hypothetical protein
MPPKRKPLWQRVRCAEQQRKQRRQQLICEIQLFCTMEGLSVHDLFSSQEAFTMEHAPLRLARKVFHHAADRVRQRGIPSERSEMTSILFTTAANRPLARLSRQNRSWLDPTLLLAHIRDQEPELLQGPLQNRPSPEPERPPRSRSGLLACHLFPRCPSDDSSPEVVKTNSVAEFWRLYQEARSRYATRFPEVRRSQSCVAFFTKADLQRLLPGIRVPRMYVRSHYLTNLGRENDRLFLDVFGESLLPLFRHQFGGTPGPPAPPKRARAHFA